MPIGWRSRLNSGFLRRRAKNWQEKRSPGSGKDKRADLLSAAGKGDRAGDGGMKANKTADGFPTVVIMGALDTKGAEIDYLRETIRHMGIKTLLMDVNMGGEPTLRPDISAGEIAAAGGGDIAAMLS